MKRFAIFALSLVTALTSVPPAMAFPTVAIPKIEVQEAQTVQYRRYRGGYGGYRGGYRGYQGGYRGYRGYYNNNDDWAWALGGFATGAIVGGLLAQPRYYGPRYYDEGYYGTYYRPRYYAPRSYRQVYYGGNTHTRWCYARYRSYRAYDDTFQPYHGPRRACVSPYY
jgi:BA14K-like protein